MSLGLQIKISPTPENNNLAQLQPDEAGKIEDASMNEMALFHEMFNSDLFDSLDLSNSNGQDYTIQSPSTAQQPEQQQEEANMMDLSSFLDTMPTVDSFKLNNTLFDAPSPQPLEFVPPTTVPKRTSNGKKIRYSKNVRLAHSALRMARERTASVNNPSDDAILNNLNVAKQKNSQLASKHAADINKLLNNEGKKEKKKISLNKSAESPKQDTVTSPPPQTLNNSNNGSGQKRRPMFILASSYLSNYNMNSNDNSNNHEP